MWPDLAHMSENELSDTIAKLYSQIHMVKKHINTRNPAAYLLPDILSEIFQIVVNDWRSIGELDGKEYLSYYWLTLTHVCSHWRTTAIRTSILWTNITLHKYKVANLLLGRSRDAPLSILCWYDLFTEIENEQQRWILDRLSPHLPRVVQVQVAFTSNPTIFPPIPNHPFARVVPLRVRVIGIKILFPFSSADSKAKVRSLGKHEQSASSPTLSQTIHADPVKAIVGINLRHLSIIGVSRLEQEAFLSILDKTPQLESFQVLCVGSLNLPLNSSFTMITLSQLRFLTVDLGTLRVLSTFLQQLSYPPTTTVHLACTVLPFDVLSETDTGTHLRHIIPKGTSTLSVTTDSEDLIIKTTNFTLIVISSHFRQSLLIKYLFSCVVTDSLEHLAFGPGIDSFMHNQWELDGIYEAIQTRSGNLRVLSLSSVHHLTHLALPRVTRKDTTAIGVDSFVSHLARLVIPYMTGRDRNTTVFGAMPFPKLNRLCIGRMDNEDIKTLSGVLKTRKKQGNMIKAIYLPQSYYHGNYKPIAQLAWQVYIREQSFWRRLF